MFRLYHYLSLGKEWFNDNRKVQIDYEIRNILTKLGAMNAAEKNNWLIEYLKHYKIDYIVFEQNDRPKSLLKNSGDIIYSKGSVSILKLK